MEENYSVFLECLHSSWRRKWLIIVGSLIFVAVAIGISFLLTPVYEVDAVILPGKFFIEDSAGNIQLFVVEDPKQIADKIRHESYVSPVAEKLGISKSKFPRVRAENIRNTLLVRMWVHLADYELGSKILDQMINLIKEEIDKKVKIEIDNLDSIITQKKIEIEKKNKELEILKNKLAIIQQRRRQIQNEMKSVKEKLQQLEEEQKKILQKKERQEAEALSLLLYSNEIQQSLAYYDQLNEKLNLERLQQEDIRSSMEVHLSEIQKLKAEIENLNQKKGRIDFTEIVKKPTVSSGPVFPKKSVIILVTGVIGFIFFNGLAWILTFFEKEKRGQI